MPRNTSRRTQKFRKTRGGSHILDDFQKLFKTKTYGGKRRKSRKMRGGRLNIPKINLQQELQKQNFDDYSNRVRSIEKGFETSNQIALKSYVDKSLANPTLKNDMGLQQKVMNDVVTTESKLADILKVGGGKRRKSRRMRGGRNFADAVKNAVASVKPDNNYNNYVSNLKNTANAYSELNNSQLRTYINKGLTQDGIKNNTGLQNKFMDDLRNIGATINNTLKTLN